MRVAVLGSARLRKGFNIYIKRMYPGPGMSISGSSPAPFECVSHVGRILRLTGSVMQSAITWSAENLDRWYPDYGTSYFNAAFYSFIGVEVLMRTLRELSCQ